MLVWSSFAGKSQIVINCSDLKIKYERHTEDEGKLNKKLKRQKWEGLCSLSTTDKLTEELLAREQ